MLVRHPLRRTLGQVNFITKCFSYSLFSSKETKRIPFLLRHSPNILTLTRISIVPFLFHYITNDMPAMSFSLLAIAGATDYLDGWIARKFNLHTPLGALLDPLADKVLAASLTAAFVYTGQMPYWLAALILSRDVLLVAFSAIESRKFLLSQVELKSLSSQLKPIFISKINTFAQILYFLCLLGSHAADMSFLTTLKCILEPTIGVLTSVSGGIYLKKYLQHRFTGK